MQVAGICGADTPAVLYTCEHRADDQEQGAEDGQGDLTVGADGYAPHGDAAVDFPHGRRVRLVSGGRRTRGRVHGHGSQAVRGRRHPTGCDDVGEHDHHGWAPIGVCALMVAEPTTTLTDKRVGNGGGGGK